MSAAVHGIDESQPHRVSMARCRVCRYAHVAVIRVDAGFGALECPKRRTLTCTEYPIPEEMDDEPSR